MTAPPGEAGARAARRGGASGARGGRRPGASGAREDILAAARATFGEYGYDRATIRRIAAAAGVDPALVHHYFGSKERLFAAAMRLPLAPTDVIDAALAEAAPSRDAGLGGHLLTAMLRAWQAPEMRDAFTGLLRTAVTSERGAAALREFAAGAILGRLAKAAGPPTGTTGVGGKQRPGSQDAEFRAALVASQVLGLALTRYVLQMGPLAQASDSRLAAAIGPTLDRYLTGDLRSGHTTLDS